MNDPDPWECRYCRLAFPVVSLREQHELRCDRG